LTKTRRSIPGIDQLESRSLLSTIVEHPTFALEPMAGSGPPGGAFTPAQLQQAYGFSSIASGGVAGTGSGQTIAIVDAYNDPNIQADLNTFDSQFGLPAVTVTRVNQTGGTSYPANDPTGGWELEEALDVEWAHAMAPGASIMLVEASSATDTDLLAAVKYAGAHANVMSMSWGGGEFSGESSYDSAYFSKPGVVFVASSGDSGAPASWPAASPDVLSVGGTARTLGAGNTWSSEVGWSGSGGGPSTQELQPAYQTGVVKQTASARATPDVAYDASPSTGVAVYDSVPYQGTTYGWIQVGGTSAGAPQWAALLAIADQARAALGKPALDATSPQEVMSILYKNPSDFHDITSGTSLGSPTYSAGPGYDYVTGMGSPIANLVVGSLEGSSTSGTVDKLVLAAQSAETAGTSFSLTVTAQNSSGATDASYLGTIHLTSSDAQAGLPANYTFTASDKGSHTFTITLKTAGSQSITATDAATSATTGAVSGISVSPAHASKFVLSGLSSTATVGVAQSVTVAAFDPYGNLATTYNGTVQFTSSDPSANLPANYTFTSGNQGTHAVTVTFETAGIQSLTVTDTTSHITVTRTGITVVAPAASTDSIWSNSYLPSENAFSAGSYEVGVKFTSSVSGTVTGARFYKQTWMSGYLHVGHLWSSTGTLLASGTFTNESASGWQQVNFPSPVAIQANTVYVISFSTGGGYFGISTNFFTRGGVTSGPLQAQPSSVLGGDGVYNRAGAFPNTNGGGMNFWADVAFSPSSPKSTAAIADSSTSRSIAASTAGYSALPSAEATRALTFTALAAKPEGAERQLAASSGTAPTVLGSTPFRRSIKKRFLPSELSLPGE
jgi:subtilase family serine protease